MSNLPSSTTTSTAPAELVGSVRQTADKLQAEVGKVIVGQSEVFSTSTKANDLSASSWNRSTGANWIT